MPFDKKEFTVVGLTSLNVDGRYQVDSYGVWYVTAQTWSSAEDICKRNVPGFIAIHITEGRQKNCLKHPAEEL